MNEKTAKIQELETSLDLTGKQMIEKNQEIDHLKSRLKYITDFADKNANEYDSLAGQIEEYKNTIKELESQYKILVKVLEIKNQNLRMLSLVLKKVVDTFLLLKIC